MDAMLDTNVRGLMQMTQVFVPRFRARNAGHIINIGSIAGVEAYPGGSVVRTFLAHSSTVQPNLLCERSHPLCSRNSMIHRYVYVALILQIRVTNIQPGMVETEFSLVRYHGNQSSADKVYTGLHPLTGDDIAEEIVWAASRPAHVNIAETTVMPVNQAGPYHVARPLASSK